MNTRLGWVFCALVAAGPALAQVRPNDPVVERTTGQVLVLDNERTLEGNIERQGDQFHVRRPLGELWIQRDKVLRLCQSNEEAYQYLRARANLRDPDERLRLAQWCHQHNLRKQALEEVTAAVDLRPGDAESQRILRMIQQAARAPAASATARPDEEPEKAAGPPPVTTDSLSLFVTRVQPLLMNACAGCHANGRGGNLKLTRTYDSALANRRTTLQNLATVLQEIDRAHPEQSALLTKAVSVHGDMIQPALKGRHTPAYLILENWVKVTLDAVPPVREQQTVSSPATPSPSSAPHGSESSFALARDKADGSAKVTAFGQARPPSGLASPGGEQPTDPFDPVIFNRQMHPAEQAESKKP
jgi:hypothetical protein